MTSLRIRIAWQESAAGPIASRPELNYSKHALQRMRQRGRRSADIEMVLRYGTQVDDNVYFLGDKDAEREIHQRKQEIRELERLRNWKVVVADDEVITCYRSGGRDQKRMLRRSRQ